MPIRATQPISSAFGSYMPGELIDEIAAPVVEAWVAAGIAEEETAADRSDEIEHDLYGTDDDPEETPVDPKPVEEATAPKPERAVSHPQVEQATAPKRERSVSPRMQTQPTPHRRFVQDDGGTR